jgi:hypothetical protein
MKGLHQLLLLFALTWSAASHAASVVATWNPSPGDNVAGYFLYIGDSSKQYQLKINVAGATQFTVVGLQTSRSYYFAVTAYNSERVESDYSNEASLFIPLIAEARGPWVVEYHEPYLDRYFITADVEEQIAAESGNFGWWRPTGMSFRSGGTVPVCRFHGNTSTNPSTGSPYGPNTYFYTADLATCNFVNSILNPNAKSMVFDRFDFLTTPALEGTCPPFFVPVYRAYNNGYAQGFDSNHRYSTDRNAILEVVARGWIDEGVRLCAPP